MRPFSGWSTALDTGASLANAKCVRECPRRRLLEDPAPVENGEPRRGIPLPSRAPGCYARAGRSSRLKEVSRKTSRGAVEDGGELCQRNGCRSIEPSGRAAAQDHLLDRVLGSSSCGSGWRRTGSSAGTEDGRTGSRATEALPLRTQAKTPRASKAWRNTRP
jgi:hypothetical protein